MSSADAAVRPSLAAFALAPVLFACAVPSEPGPPPATPSVVSASPASAASAAGSADGGEADDATTGLGRPVPLDGRPPVALQPSSVAYRPFRKGLVALAYFGQGSRCPEADALSRSCAATFFAPFAGSVAAGSWAGDHGPEDVGDWKLVPGATTRGTAFAGRDSVLVVSRDGRTIVETSDVGARDHRIPDSAGLLEIVHVVETSEGRVILGRTSTRLRGEEVEVLAVYPLDLAEGKATVGKPAVLSFAPARSIAEGRLMARAGLRSAIRIVPSLDVEPSGELGPTWTLTWVEAILPARRGPSRSLPDSPPVEDENSVALDGPGISRNLHVARLDRRGKQRGERVAPLRSEPEEQRAASLRPPTVMGRPLQVPRGLTFDVSTGKGTATYGEGGDVWTVAFDARGVPLGAPSLAPAGAQASDMSGRPEWPPRGHPELASVAPGCGLGVQVRPGVMVLLCDEPSGDRASGRLALRRYR
jgi:hypothetical protein